MGFLTIVNRLSWIWFVALFEFGHFVGQLMHLSLLGFRVCKQACKMKIQTLKNSNICKFIYNLFFQKMSVLIAVLGLF